MLSAVLFDLDGTLVDSERDNVESVVLALRRLGREMSPEERAFVIGHSWNEIYTLLVKNHGITISMEDLIASAVDEKRALMAAQGYTPLAGAVETVRRLAARCPLAVVSGASCAEVQDAVTSLGIGEHFVLLLGAERYSRGKPHPEPYALAMERLGVRPEHCIAIEDASPGIASARAAGARVIAVEQGNFAGFDLSGADVVVKTLWEVTDELCDRLVNP